MNTCDTHNRFNCEPCNYPYVGVTNIFKIRRDDTPCLIVADDPEWLEKPEPSV